MSSLAPAQGRGQTRPMSPAGMHLPGPPGAGAQPLWLARSRAEPPARVVLPSQKQAGASCPSPGGKVSTTLFPQALQAGRSFASPPWPAPPGAKQSQFSSRSLPFSPSARSRLGAVPREGTICHLGYLKRLSGLAWDAPRDKPVAPPLFQGHTGDAQHHHNPQASLSPATSLVTPVLTDQAQAHAGANTGRESRPASR